MRYAYIGDVKPWLATYLCGKYRDLVVTGITETGLHEICLVNASPKKVELFQRLLERGRLV